MRRKIPWQFSLLLLALLTFQSRRLWAADDVSLGDGLVWLALMLGTAFFAGSFFFSWLGRRRPRGAQMVPFSKLRSLRAPIPLEAEEDPAAASRLFFGGIDHYTPEAATSHFFLVGGTGSGKTLNLNMMMQSVLPPIWNGLGRAWGEATAEKATTRPKVDHVDQRAVIFDVKQDMVSTLLALGIPTERMRIFNPFDHRCYAWDMARDIDAPDTALQLASILIAEDTRETNRYFSDAARDLLCGIIQVFIEKGETREAGTTGAGGAAWHLADLILTMRTPERLEHVLSQTRHGQDLIALHLRAEVTSLNILSTARTKLAPFEVVAALWKRAAEAGRTLSLRQFLEEPLVMVLGNHQSALAPIQAINRVIFQRLTELVLDQGESRERRTWFFLDEARKIGKLSGLEDLMTNGRSKGACVVLGFQDIAGMREVYGPQVAEEILGMCGTFGVLKISGAATPQWASLIMGEREEPIVTRGFSTSEAGGVSANEGENWGIRPLLLPSQFRSLPRPELGKPLCGYFRSAFIQNPQHRDMVYRAEVPPAEIARRLPIATSTQRAQNFVPWPSRDAKKLHDWDARDYGRLNLSPKIELLLPRPVEARQDQNAFHTPDAPLKNKSL